MKRKLSLLLAVVMILGTFSFAFADEGVDVPAFLEKEGILKGNTKGDLMLDEPLLRKDAVVLLARLLKAEDEAEAFEKEGLPTFNDLAGNPYYNAFLGWAEDNGYFTGKPDGSFGYNDNLEAVEYSLVLLRALGYVNEDKAAEWDEAWDTAKKLGLLEDVKAERREEILRKEVAQMTFNALGVKMKDSDKTLAEFLGITMPEPAKLTAEVKDTENLKEVVVKLSNAKLANKDKLENTANYRIEGNVVERVEVKDNDVLVQVKDTFRSGKQYELQIRGVDKAIDGKYKFVAKDNTIPSVEKVEALGEYGIKVVTSEPVSDVRGRNFLVDGKYIVMNVETYGRNLILTPYNGSFPSDADTLTIEGLRDFAGYKSAKEDFEIEIVKDNEAPQVEDVILKGNKVEVVFDKDIYKSSVEGYDSRSSVGNISYELGRHTIYATGGATKVDTNKAVYEFKDSEAPSRRDKVTIVDVANHSKVKMEKTTMAVREVLDDIEPEIIKKKVVAKNVDAGTMTIELHFDKDVAGSFKTKDKDETMFDVDDHFTLYEGEVYKRNIVKDEDGKVDSAEYGKDDDGEYVKDVIVVELINLNEYNKDKENEYVLEIENFVDASSSRNKMYRDYYEFKFEKGTSFEVKKISVPYRGSRDTEIEIEFTKALDRDIAEDATNYIFYEEDGEKKVSLDDVADLDGEVILKGNGKVVVLEVPVGWEDLNKDYDGLKILDVIKDTKGNRLDKTYYYNLKSGLTDGEAAAIETVIELIGKLPKAADVTVAHKDQIEKARKAYDALTEKEKALVKIEDKSVEETLKILTDAEEALAEELREADVDAAVKAINEASIFTIADVLPKNAGTLGLDLTVFNTLEDKGPVYTALVGKNFVDADAIKTAFNNIVNAQKGVEAELVKVKDSYVVPHGTTGIEAAAKILVEADVDTTKVTVAVAAVSGDTYKVTLTPSSTPVDTEKAEKEITVTVAEASDDVSIKGVSVKGVIADKIDEETYKVELPSTTTYNASDIVVTATDSNASVAPATGGTADTTSDWKVEVTAQDGVTKATYTIKVVVLP